MTPVGDSLTMIVLGGYSTNTDWNNQTYTYQYDTNKWSLKSEATGVVPAGMLALIIWAW